MVTSKAIHDVLKALKNNDNITDEENNYIRSLAQKTDYSRKTVGQVICFLEAEGFVTRVRIGKRKVILLNIE